MRGLLLRKPRGLVRFLLTLALMAGPGLAGTDFASMPVGCSWTTKYSDGSVVTETFLGKRGGKYKTEVTADDDPDALIRKVTYDAKGRLLRKDWAGGKWEAFSPYSCFAEAGTCTYRYTNSGGADQKIASTTVAKGKGFSVRAGAVGEKAYPDEYFELGTFGLMTRNKASNYSARMTKMQGCGPGA